MADPERLGNVLQRVAEQLDLTAPSQSHSDTSRAQAKAIQSQLPHLRGLVYAHIRGRFAFGATDKEIQKALGMAGSTERPRRIELMDANLIKDSGQRRDRSAVWVLWDVEV